MKHISLQMFKIVRSDILRFIRKMPSAYRPSRPVPDHLDQDFLQFAIETLTDTGSGYSSIVEMNGRPHILVTTESDYFEFDVQSLCIAGLINMKDGKTKEAVEAFMSVFLRNNPFIPFSDSVWSCLYDEIATSYRDGEGLDEDKLDYVNSILEYVDNELSGKRLVSSTMQYLKGLPHYTRDELQSILDNTFPDTDKEKELLSLLKDNIRYCYEKSWDDEDFDRNNYGYASVCVNPYDFFTVHYDENDPFFTGLEITGQIYDGDECIDAPMTTLLLNEEGELIDIYDRKGFAKFCNDLSKTLNKF